MHVVFISSPYLFVFDDDRVRGTREQRMLMQVALVRLSRGVGFYWETSYVFFICFWKVVVNPDG